MKKLLSVYMCENERFLRLLISLSSLVGGWGGSRPCPAAQAGPWPVRTTAAARGRPGPRGAATPLSMPGLNTSVWTGKLWKKGGRKRRGGVGAGACCLETGTECLKSLTGTTTPVYSS